MEPFPLSDRLKLLIGRAKREGLEATHTSIAEATGISVANIRKLLQGDNRNPGMEVVAALADYFGVGPEYFFLTSEEASNGYLAALDRERILTRGRKLDPEALQAMREILDAIERDAADRAD